MLRNNLDWTFYIINENVHPVLQTINSFRDLEKGWNYGEGTTFSDCIIEYSLRVANFFLTKNIFLVEAFPGNNGEIMLTSTRGDFFIDVTINSEDSFLLVLENKISNDDVFENEYNTFEGLMSSLNEKWNTFQFSPRATTLKLKKDLSALHSEIVAMGRENQSSASLVLIVPRAGSVNTLEITKKFIHTSEPHHPTYTNSTPQAYLMDIQ